MNSPSDENRADIKPLLLRAPADIRRAFSWFAYASMPIGILAFASVYYLQHRGFWDALGGSVFVTLAIFFLGLWPQRYAVRIDSQGVATRRFLGWKCLSWADVASGRIEKRLNYVLYDPQKPFWRRELELGLAGKEARRAMEVINRYYVLPPPPDLPEQLKIRYGFRRVVVLDAQGIHVRRKGELREYTWRDVKRLHITRPDPVRRDFFRLELYLPDEVIEIRGIVVEKGLLLPSKTRCAVVDTFLRKYVPEDHTDCDISGERPIERIDVERQLAKLKKEHRELRLTFWVLASAWAIIPVMEAFSGSLAKALALAGVLAMFGPLFYVARKRYQSEVRQLEDRRGTFDAPQETHQGSPRVELP